ncbi:MFS transporter [Vibrio hannami]|uniref:MFS transporter n=1 Tax=Vibrio hannami TaxID=2717094 RepID=UPI00240FFE66|nr:MFS transporter [Vibrio hannami]MDG3084953.1 MFS transporter [Vibrio hannami]
MKKVTRYQRYILCVCLCSVITFANIYWLQPLLPLLKESFNITSIEANLAMSAPLLGMGLGLIVCATISDSLGRCSVLLVGIGLGLCVSLLLPLAESYTTFLILRFFQGGFLAVCPAVAVPLLADELRKSWLPTAVGFYIASNTLGGLCSRLIGGFGAEMFGGWASGGYLVAAISTVMFFAIYALLPKQKHFTPAKFSLNNSVRTYARHMGKLRLVLIYLTIGIGFGCFVNITNYLMLVLEQAPYSMPSDLRSMMFLTLLGGTTSSSLAGKFSQKHSQVAGIGLGIVIMTFSVLLLHLNELFFMIVGMILLAVGFFFCHANASTLIGKSVKKARGSAQALYSLFYYSGASLGVLYYEPAFMLSGWQGVLVASGIALSCAAILLSMYQILLMKKKHSSQQFI